MSVRTCSVSGTNHKEEVKMKIKRLGKSAIFYNQTVEMAQENLDRLSLLDENNKDNATKLSKGENMPNIVDRSYTV